MVAGTNCPDLKDKLVSSSLVDFGKTTHILLTNKEAGCILGGPLVLIDYEAAAGQDRVKTWFRHSELLMAPSHIIVD